MMSSTTDVGPVEAVCCSGVHYVWDVEGATRLRLLHHVMPSAVGFAKPATFARHTRAWTPEEIAAARAKARGVRQLSPRARKARKLRLKAERRAAWAGKSVGASADAAAAPLTSPTTSPALPLVGVSSPCLVMPEAVYVGLQEGWLRVAPHMEAPDVAAASTHGVDRTRAACPMCPPPSERQFQRMLVFHDLWKKGYMVTTGIKFGGDFLAYAGDPQDCHSSFIVRVTRPQQRVRSHDIVATSRVSTIARKDTVLAQADVTSGHVRYIVLKWMPDPPRRVPVTVATIRAQQRLERGDRRRRKRPRK